jgi:hypothetical protein
MAQVASGSGGSKPSPSMMAHARLPKTSRMGSSCPPAREHSGDAVPLLYQERLGAPSCYRSDARPSRVRRGAPRARPPRLGFQTGSLLRPVLCNSCEMVIFDGLYCFGSSICRLRVIPAGQGRSRVVIATDLTDSPGPSVCNAFEALVAAVSREFGEYPTRWLLHYPELEAGDESSQWSEAIPQQDGPDWRPAIGRREAESISGCDLSGFDAEAVTVAELAGDCTLFAGLASAPEPERLPGEYMRAVPVSALPFAHGPFRCPHKERFDEIAGFYEGADADDADDATVVGAHWFLTLAADDFERCEYHDRDWSQIAAASVAVLEAIGPQGSREDMRASCARQKLSADDGQALLSLFADPIIWTPGSSTLTNGQHRTCALRAAGAEFCVVDTGGHLPPWVYPATPNAAASALLAAYWTKRAARE